MIATVSWSSELHTIVKNLKKMDNSKMEVSLESKLSSLSAAEQKAISTRFTKSASVQALEDPIPWM
ncbi:MAG: hypothetical protein K0R67_1318 [Paenibacillus sp.]|jgi:hypothetical protein|nr:hypothetical protein [Paenibacillus sp.]